MIYAKRVLALAGLVQSVHLVVGAAKSGMISQDSLEKSLNCIFVQNPGSIAEVYSGTQDITIGLNLLRDMLNRFDAEAHGDLVKYCLAVIGLERSIAAQPDKLRALGAEINRIDQQRLQQSAGPAITDDVIRSLAEAYEQIVGQVQPRIKISGHRGHLQNTSNVQRIRALLLSALRSAVLWHQVGGRRWQLLLRRSAYKSSLDNYI